MREFREHRGIEQGRPRLRPPTLRHAWRPITSAAPFVMDQPPQPSGKRIGWLRTDRRTTTRHGDDATAEPTTPQKLDELRATVCV